MSTATNEKSSKMTPAEYRAELIAKKIKAGLKRPQAEEAADRQIARDANPIKIKSAKAPIPDAIAQRFDALEERIEALEANATLKK
jgi:hypothetical protein